MSTVPVACITETRVSDAEIAILPSTAQRLAGVVFVFHNHASRSLVGGSLMNGQSAGFAQRTKSWRREITIGLIVAVVGGLIVVLITPRVGEQEIDPILANEFLTGYYTEVVQPSSREEAWSKLTPEFQTQPKVGGREKYWGFWNTIRQVNVADVEPQQRKNEFRARLIYKLVNGQSQRINTTYRLKCIPWYERLPFLTCQQEHIRIRATFGTTYP